MDDRIESFDRSWIRDQKSLIVNSFCLLLIILGYTVVPEPYRKHVLTTGLFGFSGAITNWIAVHMLFERVPGLYGSGIIPLKFESFKRSIYSMMMTQFFSENHIDKFLEQSSDHHIDIMPIIDNLDFDEIFNGFVEVIEESKLGGMLAMFGGTKILDNFRAPFHKVLRIKLIKIVERDSFQEVILNVMKEKLSDNWQKRISDLVQRRLEELTPQTVKEIVQKMIRSHLGWLVIWGGVFGCLIGLITSFLPN
ncbi:MAG: DUF445 domain-containing protein [Acidobacteria bacterium]|nr:MAG: DUF445 domain-containing protein [Acidobacteriota bacterium]